MMPTACSAFGCTYRHKKGDNVGMYCFPKDERLRRLWVIAIRRANWKPSPSSRICGKHFQSGKPSKDKNHPDYVPNIFVFNQNYKPVEEQRKIVQDNTLQKEILPGTASNVVTIYRQLKPKPEGKSTPLVPIRADKRLIKPAVQFYPFSTSSGNMKENDNIGKKKIIEISNNSRRFLLPKEIRPSLPQRVWLLNFIPAKVNPDISAKSETASSVNENYSTATSESSTIACEGSAPIYVKSTVTITDDDDDEDTLSVHSDDSTISARSSMSTTEYAMLLNYEPCITASKKFSRNVKSFTSATNLSISGTGNIESSVPDSEDSVFYNAESSVIASKNSSSLNVGAIEYSSENVTKDVTDNMSIPIIKPVKETPDYDYSNFMWSHNDSKEVLAIKLETMLAVNMSLKEKVKFYQNRCKLYEKEINNLRKHNKQGPTVVNLKIP